MSLAEEGREKRKKRQPRRRFLRPSTARNIDRSVDSPDFVPLAANTEISQFDKEFWEEQRPPHWG
ncbi:hypothetical protein [Corynebacterium caspium]|uniref:hypothetical protein n=1 Tax=Corynebacterium caspium TaxID=234828 RepID=UPI000372CFA5|nr:hypothetical protein [Corynebacterium caspium]WKD59625.1 hypothetical protein CCASP_06205 [Corynebacterium caspium DSM 44850]